MARSVVTLKEPSFVARAAPSGTRVHTGHVFKLSVDSDGRRQQAEAPPGPPLEVGLGPSHRSLGATEETIAFTSSLNDAAVPFHHRESLHRHRSIERWGRMTAVGCDCVDYVFAANSPAPNGASAC